MQGSPPVYKGTQTGTSDPAPPGKASRAETKASAIQAQAITSRRYMRLQQSKNLVKCTAGLRKITQGKPKSWEYAG